MSRANLTSRISIAGESGIAAGARSRERESPVVGKKGKRSRSAASATVGVRPTSERGKCDGSQVLISAFRCDARDSKRRKNG